MWVLKHNGMSSIKILSSCTFIQYGVVMNITRWTVECYQGFCTLTPPRLQNLIHLRCCCYCCCCFGLVNEHHHNTAVTGCRVQLQCPLISCLSNLTLSWIATLHSSQVVQADPHARSTVARRTVVGQWLQWFTTCDRRTSTIRRDQSGKSVGQNIVTTNMIFLIADSLHYFVATVNYAVFTIQLHCEITMLKINWPKFYSHITVKYWVNVEVQQKRR